MISLNDLLTPVTLTESKATILEVFEDLDLPVTAWKPKAVVRAIVWVMAALIAATSVVVVLIGKAGFRSSAKGDWLTLHAVESFNVNRIVATFARGSLTLVNAAGGMFNIDAQDAVFENTATQKLYRNQAAFTLSPLETKTIDIIAIESGSESTATPGAIDSIQTTMNGVTCSNAAAVVGLDAETDDALRQREDAAIDALSSNGPAGAYVAAAIAAVDQNGNIIGVNRVRVTDNSATGEVVVTVASASGEVTGSAGDPATNLGAVNKSIQEQVVPLGVAGCTTQSATPLSVPVTYEIWLYTTAGLDDATVRQYASAAITRHTTTRPIAGDVIPPATSGFVYVGMLEAAIKSMRSTLIDDDTARDISERIINVQVTLPAANLAVASTEVPVAGTIICTDVHLVTP